MSVLGIDLGGTKLAAAVFNDEGVFLFRKSVLLKSRSGSFVGELITEMTTACLSEAIHGGDGIDSIGISVPGISFKNTGRVWAPNINGWSDYPLMEEVRRVSGEIPVTIDSDRACSILGEVWMGKARGCRDAAFIAVGTGIGAGILVNGEILRGNSDISGAIGWMALDRPYKNKYSGIGCFEYHAAGEGIARVARELISKERTYSGTLLRKAAESITSHDVFHAFEEEDPVATEVIKGCIEYWGMAIANIVSLFNPEKIILGGGVFGPAGRFLEAIRNEAEKWAQPLSMKQVTIEITALGGDAALHGAGFLAIKHLESTNPKSR